MSRLADTHDSAIDDLVEEYNRRDTISTGLLFRALIVIARILVSILSILDSRT